MDTARKTLLPGGQYLVHSLPHSGPLAAEAGQGINWGVGSIA